MDRYLLPVTVRTEEGDSFLGEARHFILSKEEKKIMMDLQYLVPTRTRTVILYLPNGESTYIPVLL